MKLLALLATLANVALSGHVAVRMPYLNPAGVTYGAFGQVNYDYPQQVAYAPAPLAYADHHHHHQAQAYHQAESYLHHAQAPVAVGYAQVPVKTAVAVPTVQHVPAAVDVPVTKIQAQPAFVQKVVEVAKPAIKTRKYEIRHPAIQKQFYDIEEHVIVRPVGSALVELDEPLSKAQKGPAVVSTLDGHHDVAVAAEHSIAVTPAPVAHSIAVTPAIPTVAITPAPHHYHHHEEAIVSVTPKVAYAQAVAVPVHNPYLHKQEVAVDDHYLVSSTPAPIHFSTPEPPVISSTPAHYYEDDSVVVQAKLAHEEAIARAHINAYAKDSLLEHHQHVAVPVLDDSHKELHHLEHPGNPEAHENQKKLIDLLTAKGGVAEIGFGRDGYADHIGDAGLTRARVLSATPSPYHAPVEEKVKTRRIVVSRPVQTLQEIDVVEPVTKVETVAVNQPAVIKTAQVGVERVHTSVPVYGKALAPAVAHAQVPVAYYNH